MGRLYILTVCSVVLACSIFFLKKRTPTTVASAEGPVVPKEWLVTNPSPITTASDVRPADQTFLTFPEWFLVFSPEEQANYFKLHTSTTFPFMAHTAQIWQSYRIVDQQISGNFPTNTGYHFMIWVIGVSASAEYAIKAGYETIIGRITDTGVPLTSEDEFNARCTADYVTFIKDRPWYEFDFKSRLKTLWSATSLSGDHFFRKIERRYILTSELLVKYAYGKLIGLGTEQVYDQALPTTAVVLENDSVQYLPRYDRFAGQAMALAREGHRFKEIAGNNSAILLTVLVPLGTQPRLGNTRTVFKQVVASDPSMERVALATPVPSLSVVLDKLGRDGLAVEHVFDF